MKMFVTSTKTKISARLMYVVSFNTHFQKKNNYNTDEVKEIYVKSTILDYI